MADSDFQILAECLYATRLEQVSYSDSFDMKWVLELIPDVILLEYLMLVLPQYLSSSNPCTEIPPSVASTALFVSLSQILFYEDKVNNLQFYDYVLTFGGEVCTYKYHFHISTHSPRIHFQIMYMWKPRKRITLAAILFVVARYTAFPTIIFGTFPVSVFSPFPQGGLLHSYVCRQLLGPEMC